MIDNLNKEDKISRLWWKGVCIYVYIYIYRIIISKVFSQYACTHTYVCIHTLAYVHIYIERQSH